MASLGVRDEPRGISATSGGDRSREGLSIEFGNIRAFRGRNVIGRFPVLETWVTLQALDRPANEVRGFLSRLNAWLPSLVIAEDTIIAEVVARVGRELQSLAGTPNDFVLCESTPKRGVYSIGFGYEEEEVARACLTEARALCLAAVHDFYDPAATWLGFGLPTKRGRERGDRDRRGAKRAISPCTGSTGLKPNLLQLGYMDELRGS